MNPEPKLPLRMTVAWLVLAALLSAGALVSDVGDDAAVGAAMSVVVVAALGGVLWLAADARALSRWLLVVLALQVLSCAFLLVAGLGTPRAVAVVHGMLVAGWAWCAWLLHRVPARRSA